MWEIRCKVVIVVHLQYRHRPPGGQHLAHCQWFRSYCKLLNTFPRLLSLCVSNVLLLQVIRNTKNEIYLCLLPAWLSCEEIWEQLKPCSMEEILSSSGRAPARRHQQHCRCSRAMRHIKYTGTVILSSGVWWWLRFLFTSNVRNSLEVLLNLCLFEQNYTNITWPNFTKLIGGLKDATRKNLFKFWEQT